VAPLRRSRTGANTAVTHTGLTSAARWVAANVPLYALNIILTTPTDLWALRYPDTHGLFMLQREAGGHSGERHLEQASSAGSVRVRSGDLTQRPAVVVASEPMDEDPAWTALASGELLHVGPNLEVERAVIIDGPPVHQLSLADLDSRAAESQHPASSDPSPAEAG
jgi:predicted glutamine amidotransferase